VDAISTVKDIASKAIEGTRWQGGIKEDCLVVTLDIKNSCNSARWEATLEAIQQLDVPETLVGIVQSYFSDSTLL